MDPPPLSAHPPAAAITSQLSYPDSANSSPRCRPSDTLEEPLPPVPGAKLRVMCSYGGHIIPRPHDKSLCYVGGDTRMVVIDRHSTLADLSSRLSGTLLNGRKFTLKYQLPNEDLDSLISVATDEDLDNMIEEYDRTTSASPPKSSRLRLFLFHGKPETATSMGSLLDDAKSETWFVDALNGAVILPRGVSDSATMDCLLELEGVVNGDSCTDLAAGNESLGGNKAVKTTEHDAQSTMPDSPMVETTSSFGSSSSSPSMSNLPPIKVRVEQDQMVGLDEQQSQMTIAAINAQKQDGLVMLSVPIPLPAVIGVPTVDSSVAVSDAAPHCENPHRVFSDDERSDQAVPTGFRKPPLPLQPVQRKLGGDAYNLPSPDSKHAGGFNLPSPDSVASDSSIASVTSLSKHIFYQDPTHAATGESRAPASHIDPNSSISDPGSQAQLQQFQDILYTQPPQQNQQHFIHAGPHYIHNATTAPVPISSYYPTYAHPPLQHLHSQIDQQYPMYLLPVVQTQSYNMPVQSNIADATVVASSRPPTPPNHTIVAHSAAYKETVLPIYPTKTPTPAKPELAAGMYRTSATPPLVQAPSTQFQQPYVGVSQMPHPSQSIAVGSAATATYGYEYAQSAHDQVYYAQHPAGALPPQYQTMTPAAAILLSQASTQFPTDNTMPQIRTSQPL